MPAFPPPETGRLILDGSQTKWSPRHPPRGGRRAARHFAAGMFAAALLAALGSGCASTREARGSRDADHWVAEGRAAITDQRHQDAARAFERALGMDYSRLDAHRGAVEAHFHLGRLGEQRRVYEKMRTEEPNNPFHAYGLAIALYAETTANAERALELLTAAEAIRRDISDIPYRRAVILLDAERYEDAHRALSVALRLEDKARYRAPMALALYHLDRADESLDLLRGLLAMEPGKRDIEMARQVAERISDPFRRFPQAAMGKMERAMAWLEAADVPQNAIDILREVLLEYPEAAMAHAVLGIAYHRVESIGEAIVHLRRAIELAPEIAQPHLYLAGLMQSIERHEDAHQAYLEALERNPLLVEAHRALGRAALERGHVSEARRHLRAWSLLEPNGLEPRLLLSRVLAGAGEIERARSVLQEVLAIDENHLEAHLSMAAIFARLRSTATTEADRRAHAREGRQHIDRVLEVQPDNAAARRIEADLR